MPLIETIGSGSSRSFGLGAFKPDGLSAATAAPSGKYLYDTLGYRTNGTYWLNTGNGPFQAYVINDRDGGGWVKVAQYHNSANLNTSSAVNLNGDWTTRERNLASGKLLTADITALHQTKTTSLWRVMSGLSGAHRYWRFRVGSTVEGHFPRAARIGFTVNNSTTSSHGTDYNAVVFTADNCTDLGDIPSNGASYSYDFVSAQEVTGFYFFSTFNGGMRGATCFIDWSDNGSSWNQVWSGTVSNNGNQCGLIRFGLSTHDPLWSWGSGTCKYVENTNMPNWGTDRDPTGYTLSLDSSSNGNYLYSKTYTNDPQGRCQHASGANWIWPSDHNYSNDAICWGFYPLWFGSNLHWMGGNGNVSGTGYSYAGGEKYFGNNSSTSMAVFVK
jgi:hypothetical protein